ncbi:MAG: type II toxin-antitoxin system HicB family antitoxin [Chloroflexi bacterium]|nr:type II toxin-antitoxin system HicB family antitoxin [Chloroflexota bacterium]MYC01951.1 type II toxin-antitoxin system HicB family antitoxin [Chloroflexota bacterium]
MLPYQINIFWSDQDGMYVAAIPDLPGCSALGETYEEALNEAQIAMSLWIDTAKEFGEPIPAPASALSAHPARD